MNSWRENKYKQEREETLPSQHFVMMLFTSEEHPARLGRSPLHTALIKSEIQYHNQKHVKKKQKNDVTTTNCIVC